MAMGAADGPAVPTHPSAAVGAGGGVTIVVPLGADGAAGRSSHVISNQSSPLATDNEGAAEETTIVVSSVAPQTRATAVLPHFPAATTTPSSSSPPAPEVVVNVFAPSPLASVEATPLNTHLSPAIAMGGGRTTPHHQQTDDDDKKPQQQQQQHLSSIVNATKNNILHRTRSYRVEAGASGANMANVTAGQSGAAAAAAAAPTAPPQRLGCWLAHAPRTINTAVARASAAAADNNTTAAALEERCESIAFELRRAFTYSADDEYF